MTLSAGAASFATLYSEASSPDLPDDHTQAPLFTPGAGFHLLDAQVLNGQPDFFTLRISEGLELRSITLLFYDHFIRGNATFIGFQQGRFLLEEPTQISRDEITQGLFSQTDLNENILLTLERPPGQENAVYGPGDYAFWINEIEPEVASFGLDFEIVSIPEPSTLLLPCLSFVIFFNRRREQISHS